MIVMVLQGVYGTEPYEAFCSLLSKKIVEVKAFTEWR